MQYFNKISELVGNTPLLKVNTIRKDITLLLKLDYLNPAGSVKDRTALGLISTAEAKGILKPGMEIVESSSGNTALALAVLSLEKGYKFTAIVDEHAPKEKIKRIKALGANVIYVNTSTIPGQTSGVDFRRKKAKELAKQNPNMINLDQYDNPDNPKFYSETLGAEILKQTDNKVTDFIGSVGTGSSLCGVAMALKNHDKNINIHAVEPAGSISFGKDGHGFLQSGPGFPMNAQIPRNINHSIIDYNYQVSDAQCFNTCRYFAKNIGLFEGDSSGSIIYQAMKIIKDIPVSNEKDSRIIVALVGDAGQSYLSHSYNDVWMEENKLIDPSVDEELSKFFLPYYK